MHVSVTGTNSEVEAKAQSLAYVVLLATIAAISGFLFGFDTAVINGVLLFLRRQFALSNLQTEIAASSLLLGCLLGAAGASMIGDRYGRKKSLVASAVLFALSALGAASASTVTLFSVARLVGGLAHNSNPPLPSAVCAAFATAPSAAYNGAHGHDAASAKQLRTCRAR